MAQLTQFERELDALFARRTDWLRRAVGDRPPGRIPQWDKYKRQKAISALARIAESIVIRERGKDEFNKHKGERRSWHPKKGKGHGIDRKKKNFTRWYEKEIASKLCVYIFWSGKRCEYVGRTGNGGTRPQTHIEKHWFQRVTRIDIYIIRTTRELAMAECLAQHIYRPRLCKNRASHIKYTSHCPICMVSKDIQEELTNVFSG